ncbi:helix-turn-helix domain-containing protein [Serratia marcescens]|uniref:helix-turn-helix domain-containing protein n=1 Tax=Serratia TaxID=613 RepID=UPI003B9F12B8
MDVFELRLWRAGQYFSLSEARSLRLGSHWRQEDAANALGVSERTYRTYENSGVSRTARLGIQTLMLVRLLPDLRRMEQPQIVLQLQALTRHDQTTPQSRGVASLIMPSAGMKAWRGGLGWTQKQTADYLGVSLRTVKNYEQGVLPRRLMLAAQAVTLVTLLPVWATYPSARLLQVLEQLVNIEVK